MFLFIILYIFSPPIALADKNPCSERCARIHVRTMDRIDFDDGKVTSLFEKQRPLGTMKDVCWRIYDHLDCMKRCPNDRNHEKFARNARFKCGFVMKENDDQLRCVSRYHSFIEVKCSTFLNEAVRLREKLSPDTTPDQQTCRYLHLNSLCLENTVSTYCPKAKKIFRRLNFRDYFLNFILPSQDTIFDDVDLDSCQIFDFVRDAKPVGEKELEEELTTIINKWEQEWMLESTVETSIAPSISSSEIEDRKAFSDLLNTLLAPEKPSSSNETFPQDPNESETLRIESTLSTDHSSEIERTSHKENSQEFDTTATSGLLPAGTSMMIPTASPRMVEMSSEAARKKEAEGLETTELPAADSHKISVPTAVFVDESTTKEALANTTRLPADGLPVEDNTTRFSTVTDEKESDPKLEMTGSEVDATTKSTTIRRVFSDDSMEYTPPNFAYSSLRAGHYSTRDRDIVTPVVVDTSTLFGMDDMHYGSEEMQDTSSTESPGVTSSSFEEKQESSSSHQTSSPPGTTSSTAVPEDSVTPLFRKSRIVVRPILKKKDVENRYSGCCEAENEVHGKSSGLLTLPEKENEVRESSTAPIEKSEPESWQEAEPDNEYINTEQNHFAPYDDEFHVDSEEESGVLETSVEELSPELPFLGIREKETLLFIYILLLAITFCSMLCILIYCVFRRKRSTYIVSK